MSRVLLALLLVIAAALALVWRMNQGGATRPTLPRAGETLVNPPKTAEQPAKTALEIPSAERSNVELPPGAANTEPVAQVPIDDRTPKLVEDPVFSAKYAALTRAQLSTKLDELEPLYLAEFTRLCNLRFEAGLYRVVASTEMEGIDASYDVLSAFDQQGVMTSTRSVAVPDTGVVKPPDASGEIEMEYQIVNLPPEVYPELYRQRAELEWLRATLAARVAAGETPR